MYGYFYFDIRPRQSNQKILAIFCATPRPAVDEIIAVLQGYCRSNAAPDQILLIGLESEQPLIHELSGNQRLLEQVPVTTRNADSPNIRLMIIPRTGLPVKGVAAPITWEDVHYAGLKKIFLSRQTVITAPGTHHFEKPSSKHCDRFIRTANALVDGAEVFFIATCCLPFVPVDPKHFYVDTGGISVLAYAINSVCRRFSPNYYAATINTFESYNGLSSFDFREVESSVILLSASTSSALEEKVLEVHPRVQPKQIVTVFGKGCKPGSNLLFDTSRDSDCVEVLGDCKSYDSNECPLCREGSIAIPMMGDQFIPVRSNSERVALTSSSGPRWLARSIELLCGNQVVRAFFRESTTLQASKNLYFDLTQLLSSSPGRNTRLEERLERHLHQAVPSSTARIIHLDDDASQLLAERIRSHLLLTSSSRNNIEIVSAKNIEDYQSLNSGVTVVAAAAIASGSSLLSVSRCLRALQKNGAVTYISVLGRMSTQSAFEKLESDLRMGEIAKDYAFHVVESITVPLGGVNEQTSWDDEIALINEIMPELPKSQRQLFEYRLGVLLDAQSKNNKGLINELFWSAPLSNERLRLTHGFVYLPREMDFSVISQADVFFVINSILHHQRQGAGNKSALRQTEYTRRTICPLMFDRFNDGVIQSSLLRAARRPELNYSLDLQASLEMLNIMRESITAKQGNKGEALREFALALALKRLVLTDSDRREAKAMLLRDSADVVVLQLAKRI
jgi:hypothetical protein